MFTDDFGAEDSSKAYDLIQMLINEEKTDVLYLMLAECISADNNLELEDNEQNIQRLVWLAGGLELFEEIPSSLNRLREQVAESIELLTKEAQSR